MTQETIPDMTPEQLAQTCSNIMHADDHAAKWLGMEIIESLPGQATLSMTVTQHMANGHGICHGGMIFTLCDTAFAHACNNTNRKSVASGCGIDFLAPAYVGDRLTARAVERSRSRRTGVYDIEVHNQDDVLLAVFRGKSYQIKGNLVNDISVENAKDTA
ncbi:MAG: hydroxyphenylacetyl-CoA thioesterase PaaI [Thiolinea sp.]